MKRSTLSLLAVLVVLVTGCQHAPDTLRPAQSPYIGSLRRLSYVGRHPTPELKEKVVLVSFFATWCFPCLVELPALQALHEQYAEKGFTVVSVGMDLEGARVLRPFAESYAIPYPVLIATDAMRNGDSPYGLIRALPSSVLLGRDGEVRAAWSGIASPELIGKAIERALNEG